MEDGLIVGIDLGDLLTQVRCADWETDWSVSTVLCKKKQENEWYVGKKAYSSALQGEGILCDKLLSLVKKKGTATLEGVKYTGEELLTMFLSKLYFMVKQETKKEEIRCVVVCVEGIEKEWVQQIAFCASQAGMKEDSVHVISREESFLYYILNQRKEIWNHEVGLFELAKSGLRYYNLKTKRHLKELTVFAGSTHMQESFSPDILINPNGKKLGDQILGSCAERMLHGRLFSSVILTGEGFERTDWAPGFMSVIGEKRRVYLEKNLFSQGCVYKGMELEQSGQNPPFTCVCEGHLDCTVSMDVVYEGQEKRLIIVPAGAVWYETNAKAEFILDGDRELCFMITSALTGQEEKKVFVTLDEFPKRPPRTTKISVQISFLDAKTMEVKVEDLGFGELFPSTGMQIRREVML